jgi:hypothetical protein
MISDLHCHYRKHQHVSTFPGAIETATELRSSLFVPIHSDLQLPRSNATLFRDFHAAGPLAPSKPRKLFRSSIVFCGGSSGIAQCERADFCMQPPVPFLHLSVLRSLAPERSAAALLFRSLALYCC